MACGRRTPKQHRAVIILLLLYQLIKFKFSIMTICIVVAQSTTGVARTIVLEVGQGRIGCVAPEQALHKTKDTWCMLSNAYYGVGIAVHALR